MACGFDSRPGYSAVLRYASDMDDLIIYLAIPVFTLTMLIEAWVLARAKRANAVGYERRDTQASLMMGVGSLAFSAVADLVMIGGGGWLYGHSPFTVPPTLWGWVLTFVLVDLAFYWCHRFHHEVRMLWASHVNHHSSRHYNLSTALRQSWTEPLTGLPFFLTLCVLGVPPGMLMVSWAFNLLYQYWVHTETIGSMGPFGWIFNTPSHHRVHHASNPRYLDRNYAGILIIWDRLFGTFEPERETPTYGLVKNIDSFNPLVIAFHEWLALGRAVRAAASPRAIWHSVFGRPGWSPDGSTMTAPELRREAEEAA